MAKYQKYAEYQDSGVEWLGRVPSIWKIGALRWKISIASGEGISSIEMSKEQESSNSVPIIGGNGVMGFSNKINSLHAIAIGRVGALCGNVHLINYHSWISDNALKITSWSDFIDSFLVYLLKSAKLNDLASKTAQPLITGEQIKSLIVAIPSIEEQIKIAKFLDHETAQIDTLIAKQEKLIELLKEKRQAVISHAVTKGLNPNVPMKDSGVEWLGEVPEHWISARLKYYTNQIVDGAHFTPTYSESGIPFLRVTDIHNAEIDMENIKYIPVLEHLDLIQRCKPEKGDLLLSKNGTIGVPKLINWDWQFSIFVSLCLIKFKKNLKAEFAEYFFKSYEIQEQIFGLIKKSTVINLHLDKIQNFWFSIPPIEEQSHIIYYLDKKIAELNKLIGKAESAIQLMQERRTALISAAVTGKIDVRHHASRPTGNDKMQTEVV